MYPSTYNTATTTGNYMVWQRLAQQDQFVEAIKTVRTEYGFGLKDAKDVVEEYRQRLARKKLEDNGYIIPCNIPGTTMRVKVQPDGKAILNITCEETFDDIGKLIASLLV